MVSGQSEAAKNEAKLEQKRQDTYIDALGNGELPLCIETACKSLGRCRLLSYP